MLSTLAFAVLVAAQDGTDEKLAKLRDLRARMRAEIEKVDADIKRTEAEAARARAAAPQDDAGLAAEVRELRREVAELRGLIKELVGARRERAVEMPPMAVPVSPVAPSRVHDGKMTLRVADPVKEVWVHREGEKEPTRFVPAPTEKPAKKPRKPDAADEQPEDRRGLLRRMYEEPESRRLLDELKDGGALLEKNRKALRKLLEVNPDGCQCPNAEKCPFPKGVPARAGGIWY